MEIVVQRTIIVSEPPVNPCGVEVYVNEKYSLCLGKGIISLTMGCVHEHVHTDKVCAAHAQQAYMRQLWCRICHTGEDPHTCELRVS